MGEMISIPVEEYRLLRSAAQELEELRTYDGAKAALAAGEEELIPAEYVKRMLAGESPLRVWRDYRGLTQLQLSEAAGVNRVQIAEIEAARKVGSIETIKKLAVALGITIDDLV
ncbi:MAG TPA: helix-turn-helix transcriptional regulator [Novosphingobium sp.]|nr:helix-turn-helix transcriptional regulator [Novosphingobium sp.]